MTTKANPGGSAIDWLVFLLLSFFWGSSYLFIKIGVEAGLQPFTLVTLRLLIGAALLLTVFVVAREHMPRDPRFYGHIAAVGFFGIALPFSLITFAEQHTTSAIAAVLTAPVPLFAIPLAAIFLNDERFTVNRMIGVVVGLIGVAVLVGFDPAQLQSGDLTGELLLVAAAISYAIGGVYARKFVHGYRPMIPALFQVSSALVMVTVLAFVFEHPLDAGLTAESLFAVVWLGLFGSGLAYLCFFRLINTVGAARTTLVAYLLPLWGIVLGVLVRNEPIPPQLVLGTILVIGGIALVNLTRGTLVNVVASTRTRLGARPS